MVGSFLAASFKGGGGMLAVFDASVATELLSKAVLSRADLRVAVIFDEDAE